MEFLLKRISKKRLDLLIGFDFNGKSEELFLFKVPNI